MSGSAAPALPRERRLTGRMVFLGFLAFFGVVVSVNAVMLSVALDTMPGLTTDSSYRASQRFNRDLAAARLRDARAWKVEARVDRDASGIGAVTVTVREPEGTPVERITVKAQAQYAARRANDRSFDVVRTGPGLYTGTAEGLVAGAHDLVIEVERDGETLYRSRNRVMLP
jgi:nitrogen fixation protein FixH